MTPAILSDHAQSTFVFWVGIFEMTNQICMFSDMEI